MDRNRAGSTGSDLQELLGIRAGGRGRKSIGGAIIILLLVAGQQFLKHATPGGPPATTPSTSTTSPATTQSRGTRSVDGPAATGTKPEGHAALLRAIDHKLSGVMVESSGIVTRILPDDTEGDEHQKFLVKLPEGSVVLIAHNLDLAPRAPVKEGDKVAFKGQFEWNDRGGVVHWTHHDPRGRHADGSITVNGKIVK